MKPWIESDLRNVQRQMKLQLYRLNKFDEFPALFQVSSGLGGILCETFIIYQFNFFSMKHSANPGKYREI